MSVSLPPKHHITNCAGQQCHERAECLRYMRHAGFTRKDRDTGLIQVQLWASYDIERQCFGTCSSKLEPHSGVAIAMLKAA